MRPQDTAAGKSVRQRLLNRSRKSGEDYNLLLTRFGVERLLYRLSRSDQADQFILKGAMLFDVWTGKIHRPTRDLDLLGFGEPSVEGLVSIFRSLCQCVVEDDGLLFDADAVTCEPIRDEQAYGGMRVKLMAYLGKARISLQIDVGFGDAVTPKATLIQFPTLLDHPAPRIRAYPPETVVAEKIQAMVSLGIANSRMKDFYDVWVLLHNFELDRAMLARAIRATFERRQTPMPTAMPVAMSEDFIADPAKQSQWRGFLGRSGLPGDLTLKEVVNTLRERLAPLLGISD